MTTNSEGRLTSDPLQLLPSELVLRILDFASPSSLATLTRLNKPWHTFIDEVHQESIYSSPSKTDHPTGAKNFSFLASSTNFSKYISPEIPSWKELCKRQTLLARNWTRKRPITRESVIQVGNEPIWRFKPDFKRRFILSTSQAGGFHVTDMDTGNLIWNLDSDTVRPFAHLEYQDGTAVWDCEGNAVEVWRTDIDGLSRGEFKKVDVLPHDRTTRGFQLSYNTLCVVSSEGQGYVYEEMTTGTPRLKTQINDLEEGAIGHLDQCADSVAFSMGDKGYHFFDKTSAEALGVIHPKNCKVPGATHNFFHLEHPDNSRPELHLGDGSLSGRSSVFPPRSPRKDRTTELYVESEPMPLDEGEFIPLEEDEWGAGMFSRNSNLFVGTSRGGRVFICPNWRKALQSTAYLRQQTAIVECDSDGSTFDLGGWLSIKDHRLMFEIQDRVYVLGLSDDDAVVTSDSNPSRPSFAFSQCLASSLAVPVSFMAIYDDCIMTTYTTLRNRERGLITHDGQPRPRRGVLPTKLIRVLSFAPDPFTTDDDQAVMGDSSLQSQRVREGGQRFERLLRDDVFQLIEMLVGEENEEDGQSELVEVGDDLE